MRTNRMFQAFVVLSLTTVVAIGSLALGARPRPRPVQSCPNSNVYCLDVWDPVTCSNGVTYSNQCYADRACATGCVAGNPAS